MHFICQINKQTITKFDKPIWADEPTKRQL